ncbi:MAG TPA: helix-turn-helix domain-containing protein [Candidatus Limnocylindria bacterium]|jgi:AcrR family transcriptional regulator|nr:helix-turn-helix domain-containing protein [Candidatus Limnocylindria bacterium]
MGVRERKKASSRRALVDAAAKLFAERGVEATTMEDIARAAGMSRTSVFNYFGYKEMILCEIGARYVEEVAGPVISDLDRPPDVLFHEVAQLLAAVATREPVLIAAVARETTHPDPARRRRAQETMRYPAVVNQMLDKLAADGALRHPELRESYGNQLVDLLSGTLTRAAGALSRDRLRAEIEQSLDLFVAGALLPARDGAARAN